MKNVLFLFSDTIVGGAETNILKISRELRKLGYNIYWCFLENNGALLSLVDFELKSTKEIGLFYKQPITSFRCYKKLVKEKNIDIVFNFGLKVEAFSRLLSKRFGIKKIISNIRSTDDWRKWYHTLLDNVTNGSVDLWVANSKKGKSAFVQREQLKPEKVAVIYNFIDIPIDSSISRLGLSPKNKRITIGVLANITKNKGYFDLVELSKSLSRRRIGHLFIFGGTDKTEGRFFDVVKSEGIEDKFNYLGYISDKSDFFKKIDIFLLPSYLEGMPTAVLEAMAHGKPVVSTLVGGIPELITNGKEGILVYPGDIEAMADGIENVFKYPDNYVACAKKKLEFFKKDKIVHQWIDVIEG